MASDKAIAAVSGPVVRLLRAHGPALPGWAMRFLEDHPLLSVGRTLLGLRGEYPGGKCAELLQHSTQLQEIRQIERLHGELQDDTQAERGRKLTVLDQAAGQFRATADFVRVSP